MKILSILLALVGVLAVPTLAGSQPNDLPGVGTFAYSGTTTHPATRQMAALDLR
ncbi:MAG TPA: hypothetical protein VHC94_16210 [Nitrobacter sp.]|jgi:hypothetical protein|nr:hypothetical protein [Nitrobacter sp.]